MSSSRCPGISSAWWGSNANPGRDDLPRKIPEFSTLAVYEVDDGILRPGCARRHHRSSFQRTRVPGQGVLTGEPTTGVLLVLISPEHPVAPYRCVTGQTSFTSATSPRPLFPGTP